MYHPTTPHLMEFYVEIQHFWSVSPLAWWWFQKQIPIRCRDLPFSSSRQTWVPSSSPQCHFNLYKWIRQVTVWVCRYHYTTVYPISRQTWCRIFYHYQGLAISARAHHLPPDRLWLARAEFDNMEAMGIIRCLANPWASPYTWYQKGQVAGVHAGITDALTIP